MENNYLVNLENRQFNTGCFFETGKICLIVLFQEIAFGMLLFESYNNLQINQRNVGNLIIFFITFTLLHGSEVSPVEKY
jgi:hypothetical protein